MSAALLALWAGSVAAQPLPVIGLTPAFRQLNNYYSQQDPRRSVIREFKISDEDPNRAGMKSGRNMMVVPQPFENHKAGQLGRGPDGHFYIALRDGGRGDDPFDNAQNTAPLLGKILRIDANTRSKVVEAGVARTLPNSIPPDNLFVGEPDLYDYGVRNEIRACGFRNSCLFQRRSGRKMKPAPPAGTGHSS